MVGEWRKVKINEIAEISRGISWKSSEEFDSYQEGTIRVYKIPHIQPNSRFQLENNKVYIRKPSNYEKYLLEDNDILMVGSNGNPERVGNVVRYKKSENALFASFLLRLRAKEYIDHEFLYYRLLNPDIQNAITDDSAGSTGLRNINALKMGELSFQLPPLNEQRKIAAILSSVDEAIEKTEAIIEQTEKVKKGPMQQLLTKGIGHTKFKKTEIGEIPEGWKVMRLEEIAKVSGGKRLPKGKSLTNVKNGHPYIRVSDMQEDGISLESIQYVPTDVVESIKRYTVKAGDIYISVAGTLGLVGIVPPELDGANLTENADRISEIKCNRVFLKYVLQSDLIQNIIEREKTISAQPKLALTRIKGFLIPLPSEDEQKEIADILLTIDKKLKNEKQKHVQLLSIKKALMQALLTGKVRVKVDDEVMSQ